MAASLGSQGVYSYPPIPLVGFLEGKPASTVSVNAMPTASGDPSSLGCTQVRTLPLPIFLLSPKTKSLAYWQNSHPKGEAGCGDESSNE